MRPRAAARLATPAWLALVLAIAAGSLRGVLDNGFVWDDGPFVVWNQTLRGPGALQRIVTEGDAFGSGGDNPYYRPVTTLSFALDVWLFGENAAGYHATNLLLHLAVCALVFLSALQAAGNRFAAGAAALLFAVHPAVVEPVAYVSARGDLLCAALMLGSWLLYNRGRRDGSPRDLGLAALAFALALFAKIVAVALVPVLALRELVVARRARTFRPLLPFVAVVALVVAARGLVLERATWESGETFASRVAAAGPILTAYVRNTLWPFDLKFFYDVLPRTVWTDPRVVGAWLLLGACAGAWLLLLRRRPASAVGIAWFCAALLPASGAVTMLYPALMADRYLYVPLVGAALALAPAIPDPPGLRLLRSAGRRAGAAAAACATLSVCVAAFAVAAANRVPAWRDSTTFWEHAHRGAPQSPYVLFALGSAYAHAQRLDDAERVLKQAVAIAPGYTDPIVNLAAVAFARGDLRDLARYTEQVLLIEPRDPVALRFRGLLFEGLGRPDLAIEALTASVAADPRDELSRRYLADLERARASRL